MSRLGRAVDDKTYVFMFLWEAHLELNSKTNLHTGLHAHTSMLMINNVLLMQNILCQGPKQIVAI